MKDEHDPWHDSHKPVRYQRTDVTGRHSPLFVEEPTEPDWLPFWGGIVMGILGAVFIFWGMR